MATTATEIVERRRRVARLLADGRTPRGMAAEEGVSLRTIKYDLKAIRENPRVVTEDSATIIREAFALSFSRLRELTKSEDPRVAGMAARGLSLTATRYSAVTGLRAPKEAKVEVTGGQGLVAELRRLGESYREGLGDDSEGSVS